MPIDDRLDRWEQRQDALIAAVGGLTDILQTNQALLTELMRWLQQPPRSDLSDLIRVLVASLTTVQEQVVTHGAQVRQLSAVVVDLGRQVADLPAAVARAVATGQVA